MARKESALGRQRDAKPPHLLLVDGAQGSMEGAVASSEAQLARLLLAAQAPAQAARDPAGHEALAVEVHEPLPRPTPESGVHVALERELHKCIAPGRTRDDVAHQAHRFDGPKALELLLNVGFSGGLGEAPHEQRQVRVAHHLGVVQGLIWQVEGLGEESLYAGCHLSTLAALA